MLCQLSYPSWQTINFAAGQGFEPRYQHPKCCVLPLDDPASQLENYIMCQGQDSNLQTFRRYHLKIVRLPNFATLACVDEAGVEPARAKAHSALNAACLPISPPVRARLPPTTSNYNVIDI